MWETLRSLVSTPIKPWLMAGDFNEVLFSHEKQGGMQGSQQCMEKFRETLEVCGLEDLGYEGDMFTWRNNNFTEEGFIRERLDRAVANKAWRELFPLARVLNGDQRHSDHRPIIIETCGQQHNG